LYSLRKIILATLIILCYNILLNKRAKGFDMGYMHIENLYKNQDILLFKECYAMEKIHGTSAHISWNNSEVHFFAGGEKHENFVKLFDVENLRSKFLELGHEKITVYGEAYGGRCQGMSKTYGKELRFVAFDVKVDECWLNVPNAEQIAQFLSLDFVAYAKTTTDIEELNRHRDLPSFQAVKNGIKDTHKREGIVIRPLIEVIKNNGARIIAKHKAEEFQEIKTPRNIGDKLQVLTEADAIAEEWVTPMRLNHILQKFPDAGMEQTSAIIAAMIEDVEREGVDEIVISPSVRKTIGRRTALMFKELMKKKLVYKEGK
jgi:hypothetical protein